MADIDRRSRENDLRVRLLRSYGVEWVPRELFQGVDAGSSQEDLETISREVNECRRCGLAPGRTKVVFGDGSPTARLMFIGEGPGRDEDLQGIPFVGKAGQLLTRMITNLGLRREEVYIANVVKCRPPGNRDPQPEEVQACINYLRRQIEAVDPEVIVTLGRVPTRYLLGVDDPIHRLRGKVIPFGERKVIPTYHPSYLLRYPQKRWETWEDMKFVLGLLGLSPPPDSSRKRG